VFIGSWAAHYDISLTLKPQDAPTSTAGAQVCGRSADQDSTASRFGSGTAARTGSRVDPSPERRVSCVGFHKPGQLPARSPRHAAGRKKAILSFLSVGAPAPVGIDGYLADRSGRTSLEVIDGLRPFEQGSTVPSMSANLRTASSPCQCV
jgi:hypothetical protein